jgi:hypothetical protein
MRNIFKPGMRIAAQKIAISNFAEMLKFGTVWNVEHFRAGRLIDYSQHRNLFVDEGITYALDAAFSGGTAITSWYVVLFEDNHTPAAGDTYATPGFTETTAYTESSRPAWSEAGVSGKQLTNSASKASFTFNATKTIYGGGLVGGGTAASTKGDAAGGGKLLCESAFTGGSKSVESTDVLKVTVTLTGQDA